MNFASSTVPPSLKRRWWAAVFLFSLAGGGGYLFLHVAWTPLRAGQWGVGTAGTLLYLLGFVRVHLPLNRRRSSEAVWSRLGLGNVLTLVRGLLYGLLAGFIVGPVPSGVWAYVPGALYTAAALTDLLDGRVARRRGETTDLGAKLDVEVDAVGVLVASVLAVKFGQLPLVFVGIGGLYYAYRLSLWWRRRRRLPVHPLPEDTLRSTVGGFQVGGLCAMLWPVFEPPLTTWAGVVLVTPVLFSFGRDWLVAAGYLDPESHLYRKTMEGLHVWFVERVSLALRFLLAGAGFYFLIAGGEGGSHAGALLILTKGAIAGASGATALQIGGLQASVALLIVSMLALLVHGQQPLLIFLTLGALILTMVETGELLFT